MKVLGVTFTNSLSVSEHVQTVIGSCAQTLYVLRILRAHGMDDTALQTVYRSVIITKLTYASDGALPVLQIDKELMLLFDKVSVVVLFSQTSCHLPNYVVQRTRDYLIRFSLMCSITYCHHHQWPPKVTATQT